MIIDSEAEQLEYEESDIKDAFEDAVFETRGWISESAQGFAVRKPFAWFVFQLSSDTGSAKILGRQTSEGKDDFNTLMIKSLHSEKLYRIEDQ